MLARFPMRRTMSRLIAASRRKESRTASPCAGSRPEAGRSRCRIVSARSAIERLIEQLPNSGEGLVIAVFYIGANTTAVTVMHDGEAIYEREQPFGGQQLTGDISRTYGIPSEEAEQKKRSGDLPVITNSGAEAVHDTATIEITRALQFSSRRPYSELIRSACRRLSSARRAGRCTMERSQVPASVISPFKGMEISSNIREKQLRLDAPHY